LKKITNFFLFFFIFFFCIPDEEHTQDNTKSAKNIKFD
jgi:hypothetical protein